MLHPRASSPPSAKNSAWTVRTEAIARKAAWGPRRAARIMPPPRWPLDPVPGIEKLIIGAANTNAAATPMRGAVRSSIRFPTLREHHPTAAVVPAQKVPPTAGESRASDMCMAFLRTILIHGCHYFTIGGTAGRKKGGPFRRSGQRRSLRRRGKGAVLDSPCADQPVGDPFQIRRLAAQHQDFETMMGV